ncbi:TAP domain protein [Metarhizium acridum CQMa 102]|uniref:TAP domain protein n=1 Tax=Metarhizium acridum (strain CQMa 102) TaxID=655827 RepID=E9DY94_METAQ|nr:TAP domain protein [Metarhizium acridum CQMa 102]EFY91429.1 TAP domain protein [Metarhizium acridum CQMa 102]
MEHKTGFNTFPRLWFKLVFLGISFGALWQGVEAAPAEPRVHVENKATSERFPKPNDPFNFIPCPDSPEALKFPLLNDTDHRGTWGHVSNPNPDTWAWGESALNSSTSPSHKRRGLYFCGYLDVPLDYHNKSDPRITRLAVVKYQVSGVGKKSQRTIVLNPGGPGGSGVSFALKSAENLAGALTNGTFDVLSWDPRGVGFSQPQVVCFPYAGLEDRWSLTVNKDLKESPCARQQLETVNAINEATFRSCHKTLGDFPRFTSTATIARDVESIRIALNETQLTGYFASYGTTLAQIYANMFPDSVGRIILDGMDYARDHRAVGGYAQTALYNTTDVWNDGFLGECVAAGPERCALAKPVNGSDMTLGSLKERMQKLLQGLAERPIPTYSKKSGPLIITYSDVVSFISGTLYTPSTWPSAAKLLQELEEGKLASATAMVDKSWSFQPPNMNPEPDPGAELLLMVVCGDASDASPPGGLDVWESLWRDMVKKSFLSGHANFASVFPCRNYKRYWPKGAEVYRGDFNQPLRNPLLLASPTHDPVTPLVNGRKLLSEMGMKNARLIVHHGYGHGTWAHVSKCTDDLFRAYLLNGTVPDKAETHCYADVKPYRPATTAGSRPGLADLEAAYQSAIPRF